jgi:hypothetical protein|tara:strand:- start:304 stop:408 length:105 start_codon:yes stop_codon:yes gene_type:complete
MAEMVAEVLLLVPFAVVRPLAAFREVLEGMARML